MKTRFNKIVVSLLTAWVFLFFFVGAPAFAQNTTNRYALIIGNANYTKLPKLRSSVNDASDMADILKELGWNVTLLLDADLPKIEEAVLRLGDSVSIAPSAIGLFYYAGHGVQTNGVNYLIPADADITGETFLKTKSLSVQSVLDELQKARNNLNIIILDACRDNPFTWARSGSRGLSVLSSQPPGSIIVYATSAGSVAREGAGRNGIFTAELLKNLKVPGLEIEEVLNRTCSAVQEATYGEQNPAVYKQFFKSFYFNELKEKQKPIEPVILSSSQAADLLVRASEPDSEIYINDVYKGKAPLLIQKVEPKKPIKVSAKTATSSGTDEVTLEPGELREITVSMAPLRGNLVIIANESDVEVLIDGEARGPIGSGVFRALPLGLHNVELVGKDSYYSQKAEIRADTTTQMTATLTPVGSIDIRIPTDALAKLHIGSEIRIIEGPGIVRNLPEGNYYIEAGGKDYVSAMAFLNVRKGQEVSWEPYKNGSISFDVLTKGSTLFIKELSRSYPAQGQISDIPPGLYHGVITKSGYKDSEIEIDVQPGKKTVVKVSLFMPEAGRIVMQNYGVDIAMYVNGKYWIKTIGKDGLIYYENLPINTPLKLEFELSSYKSGEKISIPTRNLKLEEGQTLQLALNAGKVRIPLAYGISYINVGGKSYPVLPSIDDEFITPWLPVGKYYLSIDCVSGTVYTGYVEVEKDRVTLFTDHIAQMIVSLQDQRAETAKSLEKAKDTKINAQLSLGVGIVGAIGAVASYIEGAKVKSTYDAATDSAEAASLRMQVQLYQILFPVAATIGGGGLATSFVLNGQSNTSSLQRSIDDIDEQIRELQRRAWNL